MTDRTALRGPDDFLPPLDDDRPAPAGGSDSLPLLIEDMVAAVAFNEDRTDSTTLWFRYVTAWRDRQGDRLGPDLLHQACDAVDRGYETVRIVADNPFAYEACHKAGFGLTGRETGIAELVLERPAGAPVTVSREAYQSDLDYYRVHDLDGLERAFLTVREGVEPPEIDAGHSDD